MTEALIFSWSGSFRQEFAERKDTIAELIDFVREEHGMEVGLIADEPRDEIEAELDGLDLDFAVGDVENITDVLGALYRKYDKVFFVTDVRAEIAAVNNSGAFTVGYNSDRLDADDLSGAGPNYIVDSMDELRQILRLEHMR